MQRPSRRLKRYYIDRGAVTEVLFELTQRLRHAQGKSADAPHHIAVRLPEFPDLPRDAIFLDVTYDSYRGAFGFLFSAGSFEEHREGDEIASCMAQCSQAFNIQIAPPESQYTCLESDNATPPAAPPEPTVVPSPTPGAPVPRSVVVSLDQLQTGDAITLEHGRTLTGYWGGYAASTEGVIVFLHNLRGQLNRIHFRLPEGKDLAQRVKTWMGYYQLRTLALESPCPTLDPAVAQGRQSFEVEPGASITIDQGTSWHKLINIIPGYWGGVRQDGSESGVVLFLFQEDGFLNRIYFPLKEPLSLWTQHYGIRRIECAANMFDQMKSASTRAQPIQTPESETVLTDTAHRVITPAEYEKACSIQLNPTEPAPAPPAPPAPPPRPELHPSSLQPGEPIALLLMGRRELGYWGGPCHEGDSSYCVFLFDHTGELKRKLVGAWKNPKTMELHARTWSYHHQLERRPDALWHPMPFEVKGGRMDTLEGIVSPDVFKPGEDIVIQGPMGQGDASNPIFGYWGGFYNPGPGSVDRAQGFVLFLQGRDGKLQRTLFPWDIQNGPNSRIWWAGLVGLRRAYCAADHRIHSPTDQASQPQSNTTTIHPLEIVNNSPILDPEKLQPSQPIRLTIPLESNNSPGRTFPTFRGFWVGCVNLSEKSLSRRISVLLQMPMPGNIDLYYMTEVHYFLPEGLTLQQWAEAYQLRADA